MKMLTLIIRAEMLGSVVASLQDIGVNGMTVSDVRGHGIQKGVTHLYRGMEYHMDFLLKSKIEIVINDDQVDPVIEAVTKVARTGDAGDGKIFITDVIDVVRIRTGERGPSAI